MSVPSRRGKGRAESPDADQSDRAHSVSPGQDVLVQLTTMNLWQIFETYVRANREALRSQQERETTPCSAGPSAADKPHSDTPDYDDHNAAQARVFCTTGEDMEPISLHGEGGERIDALRDDDGRITALQLAVFRLPICDPRSVLKIVKHANEYLYIHDEDQFLGYGRFTGTSHIDFFLSSNFAQTKAAIIKEFQIDVVLVDTCTASREKFMNRWKNQLKQVVAKRNSNELTEMIQVERKFEATCDRSMEILEYIFNVSSLPIELKDASKELYDEERKVEARNQKFGCFSPVLLGTFRLTGVPDALKAMCLLAFGNHYQTLEELFKNAGCFRDKIEKNLSSLRSSPMVLRISEHDIEYFKTLDMIAAKFCISDHVVRIFLQMWDTFLKNVTKPHALKTLPAPVYSYLFTSFLETVTELSVKTKRKVCDNGDIPWKLKTELLNSDGDSLDLYSIRWPPGSSMRDRALEKESRFLVHLMHHVKTKTVLTERVFNKCRTCNPTIEGSWQSPYELLKRVMGKDAGGKVRIESLIWSTILRNSVHFLITESRRKEDFFHAVYEELLKSLESVYVNYATVCDSFESCRVMVRGIVCFATQMFDHMERLVRLCDEKILRSQRDLMSSMLDFQKHGMRFAKYLPPLVAECVSYWENRKEFDLTVGANLTYDPFLQEIQDTCDDLHATLHAVLYKTELNPDLILDYLRLFNEFLTTFQHINFLWLVHIDPAWDADLADKFRKIVNGKNTSHYEVTDQKAFVEALTELNIEVPKHYVLAIARRLTNLVYGSLNHEASSEEIRVQGTGNLLEAVRKAFIHLDDQVDYHSFEQFENDLLQPFESIVSKINNYADFKRHLDNLENYFVYTRRQNEISIDKALEMFEKSTSDNDGGTQSTNFDAGALKESFTVYDEAFKFNISQYYSEGVDVLETIKSTFPVQNHSKWDTTFKRERVPVLLAAVSAFWSIQESVHVIDTGNSIKPHCIQILCVLRLLNVDQEVKGLRKHLAEVLTGQGKSLVLGLLASVLALTGHSVQIVCYSKYLANRDQLAFEEFFMDLGIRNEVNYGTFDDLANEVLRIEMNGTVRYARDLFQDMILDTLPAAAPTRTSSVKSKATSVLLVDEVDVFFTQRFYGNTYRLCVNTGMPMLTTIQEEIWNRVSNPRNGQQTSETIENEIEPYITQIVQERRDERLSKFYETSKKLFKAHVKIMIDDALTVHEEAPENSRFKLNDEEIVTLRDADGLYRKHYFEDYRNSFNYLRLKKENFNNKDYRNYGYLNISCGEVSYAELPNECPVILGVSGTISTLSREENSVIRDSYGIKDVSCMPTFFGKVNLAFDPNTDFQVANDEKQWQDTILQRVREQQQQKRAVIVFFETEWDINKFVERFNNDLTGVNTLTGNEEVAQLERGIKDAGVAGSLTLAVRAMGRGIDYRTSLTVEQNGGVHVVQTFLSLDVKEEVQIKGRTARKDNKGSYELVLCKQQMVADGVLGSRDNNISYEALHAKRISKAATLYQKNGRRVARALEKHRLSLELIKSFATYKPSMRSSYLSKYPFKD